MRNALALAALLNCAAPSSVRAQTDAVSADSSFVCRFPETPAELIGGLAALQAELRWPTQNDIVCTVIVSFTVETDGSTSDPVIRRTCRPDLDAAALDALGRVRFRPGTLYMEPVAMRMSVPVRFNGIGGRD